MATTYTIYTKANGQQPRLYNAGFDNLYEAIACMICAYSDRFDENYFPQADGSVKDADGHVIYQVGDTEIGTADIKAYIEVRG